MKLLSAKLLRKLPWRRPSPEAAHFSQLAVDRRCACSGQMDLLVQSGREIERRWRGRVVPALACARCCFVAFDPPTAIELDDYYRTEYGKGSESYYTYEADHEARRVASRADLAEGLAAAFHPAHPDAVILELGCAYGGPVAELRQRGRTAFGLDLNSRAIAEGRARGNAFLFDVPAADFRGIAGTAADVIYSYHMLEHVRDLRAYLISLHEVLSDGGVALFRVPNGAYLRAWLQGFNNWDWFAFPDHLHMLSPTSAAALVEACGFELVGLQSNACGESPESIAAWLRLAVPRAMAEDAVTITQRLADAGCLMELEFILRKSGGLHPPDLQDRKLAAQSFAARAAVSESAIRRWPSDLSEVALGDVRS